MAMLTRTMPDASPLIVFTPLEIQILDEMVADRRTEPKTSLSRYLIRLARLGGYLARTCGSGPGNKVMWRGWSRPIDIQDGYSLATEDNVGN
jgi:hypothetical protein